MLRIRKGRIAFILSGPAIAPKWPIWGAIVLRVLDSIGWTVVPLIFLYLPVPVLAVGGLFSYGISRLFSFTISFHLSLDIFSALIFLIITA